MITIPCLIFCALPTAGVCVGLEPGVTPGMPHAAVSTPRETTATSDPRVREIRMNRNGTSAPARPTLEDAGTIPRLSVREAEPFALPVSVRCRWQIACVRERDAAAVVLAERHATGP